MLKSMRFPFLYVIEFLLWVSLLAGFANTTSFLAAKPIANFDLQGKSLPPSWEAAIANHGGFLEGFLISSHPFRFSLGVALLIVSAVALYPVNRAYVSLLQTADRSRKIVHYIAHFVVTATLVAIGYFVFTQVVISVAPA
jgi:hypothetical protein